MKRILLIFVPLLFILIAGVVFWYCLQSKEDTKPITFILDRTHQNGVVYRGEIFRVLLENPDSKKASFFINTRSEGEKLSVLDDSLNYAEEGACLVLKINPVATGKVILDVDREIDDKFEEFILKLEVK